MSLNLLLFILGDRILDLLDGLELDLLLELGDLAYLFPDLLLLRLGERILDLLCLEDDLLLDVGLVYLFRDLIFLKLGDPLLDLLEGLELDLLLELGDREDHLLKDLLLRLTDLLLIFSLLTL